MAKTKLSTTQESRYQDTIKFDPKLAVYRGGVDKVVGKDGTLKNLPEWLGEATILRIRNGLERMREALENDDVAGADKTLAEVKKDYDQNTLIPIGYAWQEKELDRLPAEKRLEHAIELGKNYIDLRRRIDIARSAGESVSDLERIAA